MTGNKVFLHLSDLHFGDENETNSAKRKNTLKKLLLTFEKLPTEWKPQSIAISGDIGWHGLENDYKIAEIWLLELLKTLDLSANDIIPAPGNHDINLKIAKTIATPSEFNNADTLLDLDFLANVSEPFKGFEDFCKKMKIPRLTLGSKSSYLAGCRVHNGITWLVLNSAWFCREGRKGKLHIGLPHLDVITAAESWEKRDIPTIGILHHPIECLHTEELNSYGSRRNTYDFLAGECHMILSGHVHGMLKHPHTDSQKSYLFTGGSSYSDETVRNNFSIFRLDISSGIIERRAYEWNPSDGEWEHREKYSKAFPFIGIEKKPIPEVVEDRDLHRRLFISSRRHYEDLCGENGRFRHLDISDIILQKPNKEWLDSTIKSFAGSRGGFSKEPLAAGGTLLDVIPLLWQEGNKHAVVKGDGGMGKTVSLVRLWDEFTKNYDAACPVSVFIQLNEINTVPEEKRMDFILSTIRRDYFDGRVSEDEIMRFLRDPRDIPAVVLLLDGFNEVTVDNKELLIQLRKLMEQARGVQVVITSRYDMRTAYGWEHLHLLELRGLGENQVREYLEKKKSKMPEGRLQELLRNPMMLTLYTSTCEVHGKYEGDFKEKVETAGELLWNFMEAQVAVLLERLNYDEKKWWFYKFLLKFMLPAMGYEMEKAGLFAFDRETLYTVLDTYCSRFSRTDFFETFAGYDEYEEALQLGECGEDKKRRKRRRDIVEILCKKLLMVVKEGEIYRFLHQDFRDFFVAVHILNEVAMGLSRDEVAEVLTGGMVSFYPRRFIGEIEGEHYCKPYLEKGKGWQIKPNESALLARALAKCRRHFAAPYAYAVANIMESWKSLRGEWSGLDLSRLDLSKVLINGTVCSRLYKKRYLAARFDESLIPARSPFPEGHLHSVSSAVYSPDDQKILSTSWDHTIKEWDVASGVCLQTYEGHTHYVNSAVYSADGQKILSGSTDKTIKEWDVASGTCLRTYQGHMNRVTNAVYSADGKKILSASRDQTIKEWDTVSGTCLCTYQGHTSDVNSTVYSADGQKILSASEDQTIKEWNVASGNCFRTYQGHEKGVSGAVYSADGQKILSASEDQTIKEWDVASGACLRTYQGHENGVSGAVYNIDGQKILSASWDDTIKEWDIVSGTCLRTYQGHTNWVTDVVYSANGKKILSTSRDQTIKEWDVASGNCLRTYQGYTSGVKSAVYSADGQKILFASEDQTIKEWDTVSGTCLRSYQGHTHWITSAVYSTDGQKILSASRDQTIKEWDTVSGTCLRTYQGHEKSLYSAVYNADCQKILSVSRDQTIKEWDTVSGTCLRTYQGHTSDVESVEYSTDGQKILSASNDKTIKEWDVASGTCLRTYQGHTAWVTNAVYSADGQKILSASKDQTIKEWDVASGNCFRTYQGHEKGVSGAVYSADGKKILSASEDQTIKEWDVASGTCLRTYRGHTHWVQSSVYSTDSQKILSASRDGTIKEWDVETNKTFENRFINRFSNSTKIRDRQTKQILHTLKNIPGLFIQGCSFKNLHQESDLSEESKKLMRQYGALL